MDSMRRENEKVPAVGNMPVNAKGDQIRSGIVTKTADQIARENHRTHTAIVKTGLKGPLPKTPDAFETPKKKAKEPVKANKQKETELPSGDIIMGDDNDN
jgi:hypothetical protein